MISVNQALSIIRLKNNDKILVRFLFHYLKQTSIQKHLKSISVQGAQPNLNLGDLGQLNITIPTLPEQEAIARTLNDMDEEIELLVGKLNKYRSLKEGLMQELLTGRIRLV